MSSHGAYYHKSSNNFDSGGGQLFNSNQYSGSDKAAVERIKKSIKEGKELDSDDDTHTYQLKEDEETKLQKQKTKKHVYKDAMTTISVLAYATGHLANDLII